MQKSKGSKGRIPPQLDNQLKGEKQSKTCSAEVSGNSLNVNENDVRDQGRPATDDVNGGEKSHKSSAKVAGNSLKVNENDVRD